MDINGYLVWFLYSVAVGIFCAVVALIFSYICYQKQWKDLVHIMKNLLRGKRKV